MFEGRGQGELLGQAGESSEGLLAHLHNRDATLVYIFRAPLAKIEAYKARKGWTFPLVVLLRQRLQLRLPRHPGQVHTHRSNTTTRCTTAARSPTSRSKTTVKADRGTGHKSIVGSRSISPTYLTRRCVDPLRMCRTRQLSARSCRVRHIRKRRRSFPNLHELASRRVSPAGLGVFGLALGGGLVVGPGLAEYGGSSARYTSPLRSPNPTASRCAGRQLRAPPGPMCPASASPRT